MRSIFLSLLLLAALPAFCQQPSVPDEILTPVDEREVYIDSLLRLIGDKRIVAIGEETHGTADFYEIRAAITKRLIQEKGFNMLILENPHEDMIALQKGLGTQDIDTLMRKHLFSIYQSAEMREFLNWFAIQSAGQKNLRLAGCDDSFRELIAEYLQEAAARYNNDTLNEFCKEFLLRQTLDVEEYYAQLKEPKPDSLPKEAVYMQSTYRFLEQLDTFCLQRGYDDPFLKEMIFHAKTNFVYYDRMLRKLTVTRDGVMGDRINFHAADPSAKIIVWAHNGHIARYPWLDDELGLMGATVAQAYPNDYFAIGLGGAEGTYSYLSIRFINNDHVFDDTLFNDSLIKPKPDSWNGVLAANKQERFLVDFSRLSDTLRKEWTKPRMIRMLGYRKDSGNAFYEVVLPELYDVYIFLRNTHHTTAIF